ncbi:hypothetical protein BJG93_36860 (plasmid) [Paraburkholderia sprentiae WSM5005]|uniref:Uncharacterized protein n=1 Tax=Paraburkholderia sprentiae WSM5005 TaxID=754502 RepID=A0A8F4KJE5_9BURK|nr:hypothetical protein [Paraburkholderia sprentiae]QXE07437.1 hypothetical protein BJG93_36860 [Paraburkholderia sprentiae WSM5005]
MSLAYPNFKNSIKDSALHAAAAEILAVLAELQKHERYRKTPQGFGKHPIR